MSIINKPVYPLDDAVNVMRHLQNTAFKRIFPFFGYFLKDKIDMRYFFIYEKRNNNI